MAERDTSSAHSNLRFPAWQPQFEAVLFEADPLKLPERVQAAETFIFLRMQELINSPDGYVERQALADATRALRAVKTEKMNYPDWNAK